MMKKIFLPFSLCLCFVWSFYLIYNTPVEQSYPKNEDHAREMFEWWYSQRALPFDYIPAGAYQKAALTAKTKLKKENRTFSASGTPDQWVSIGPNNVGGRVLSIAVNPVNTDIVWAGSASGGLWKSTTGGEGAAAWTYVNTGFNALTISTIVIDPTNVNKMYIGTGEISFYKSGMVGTPGARSSYGIGILRSTDGGTTWSQTDFAPFVQLATAVEKIIINPLNTNTLFAATSEGVYKSTNAGAHWTKVSAHLMAMDIIMDPDDTTAIYAAHGNLSSTTDPGLYKSRDAGLTWRKLTNGLPSSGFGRTALAISPTASFIVYAGITDSNSSGLLGLYSSADSGASWVFTTGTNYVGGQGWYANAMAVNPNTPESLFCAGLDIYRSINGGTTLAAKSDWTRGYMGQIPAGGSEGHDDYAHADHHAITFDPVNTKTIYFGTDGGVFKSTDGGNTFYGCNGGFVTTQFYNGFANSTYDSGVALGGLQDNGVVKYEGTTEWRKVDGGDGGWNAINRLNDHIMYDEYVYLTISRSNNGGNSWQPGANGIINGSNTCNFIAPFAISYSDPNILYAGAKILYKSTDGGQSWFPTNSSIPLNGTKIASIGISYTNPDTVIAATGSSASQNPTFGVFVSTNGGQTWQNQMAGLPNRYPTDMEFDPTNSKIAYVTFSGYATGHIFRTTNLGQSWTDISSGVDIPHQSIVLDPADPTSIYVGTDLGVYHSSNTGATWEDFSTGMMPAMVLDLGVSISNTVLRAATFGNGVFERKLSRPPTIAVTAPNGGEVYGGGQIIPVQWSEKFVGTVKLEYSLDNGTSWHLIATDISAATQSYNWNVPDTSTTQGKIRISEAAAGTPVDVTDGVFTIIQNPDVFGGWNLVSVHLRVADGSKSTLFPGATSSAFSYNGLYVPNDTLTPGIGYWLKFDVPQNVAYAGDSILTDTIPVSSGWNLVGTLSKPVAAASITSSPPGIISSSFFGFNSSYIVADSLIPRQGYWIRTSADGELILQNSTAAVEKSSAMKAIASYNILTIRDADGKKQSLYFTAQEQDVQRYDMPPLPPEEIFDVRFQSQRYVERLSPKSMASIPIALQGVHFPLTIKWEIREAGIEHASLRAGGQNISLTGTGSETVGKFGRLSLEVQSGDRASVPTAFTLEQNYPNPFNPSTRISFGINRATLVTLKVYDVTGRQVATIVEDELPAGTYSRTWDAGGFPSGVYYYQLRAGDQEVATRKLVLIK